MNATDPFHILGLSLGASHDEVRRAYRKLAMRWHPDRNQHSNVSDERFKHIKWAYEIAIDKAAYRAWQDNRATLAATKNPGDVEPAHVAPIEQSLELSLEEVARGGRRTIQVKRPVVCSGCAGLGQVSHAHSLPCPQCQGIGRVRGKKHSLDDKCPGCAGRGYVRHVSCEICLGSGSTITQSVFEVRIPIGLQSGETLRLSHADGNILLHIEYVPHPFFTLQGEDLHCNVPLDVFAIIAGGDVEVPTLGDVIRIALPPVSLTSEVRLEKMGLPRRHGRDAGDLVFHLQAIFPTNLSPSERIEVKKLASARHSVSRSPELHGWKMQLEERRKRA